MIQACAVADDEFEAVEVVVCEPRQHRKRNARDQQELLRLMAEGQTLTQACRKLGLGFATVWQWRQDDKSFDEAYVNARKAMADVMADGALNVVRELAEADSPDKTKVIAAHNYSQRASWYASKMLPKLYGDQPSTNVNIDNRKQVIVLSDEKRAELQGRLERLQLDESKESNNGQS